MGQDPKQGRDKHVETDATRAGHTDGVNVDLITVAYPPPRGTRRGSLMTHLFKLMRDCRGASAIEYAMVAALIAVAAMAGFTALGSKRSNQYNHVNEKL